MEKEVVIKENGQLIYDLVKEVVDATGPRLPGTKEEKVGCSMVAAQITRELGVDTVTEEFKLAPTASIAAIPLLGFLGLINILLFYLSPIASLVVGAIGLVFAVLQIFTYSGKLDFMFPQAQSQNVYATLPPKSGKADITLLFSGHLDSSWCWQHSKSNPKTMILKTAFGIVSFVAIIVVSLILVCNGAYSFIFMREIIVDPKANIFNIILYCLPLIFIIGCYWLATFLSYDKAIASPGAMDNMSGVALSIAVAKYYKNNPDKLPDNVRIMVAGLGSEEAGLKGAIAFCDTHKNDADLFNENLYVINLDSFRDDEHFNAVKGDIWLFSHFDKGLIDLSIEAMKEAGLKPSIISNPVGGCDSTPFCRCNIKTVTLNAQNPTATSYYHTTNDTVEGLSMYSLEKAFETVLNLVPKVIKNHKKS